MVKLVLLSDTYLIIISVVLCFRDLYPHSLECILSVIWSISTSLAFDPIFGAKAGGVRESDFHADLALE